MGAILRLIDLGNIEWKGDERWMFERSLHVGIDEPWPVVGVYSGPGLNHPGFSVRVIVALGRMFGAHDPVGLARAIAIFNVLGFIGYYFLATEGIEEKEREPWLWGGALAAVSPVAVLLQRKIWIVSVLAPFCVLFLFGWLKRGKWWGAFLWGLAGAFLPQIHMSGFFMVPAFVAWEIVTGNRWLRTTPHRVRWLPWGLGSVLGFLNLIPWIEFAWREKDKGGTPHMGADNIMNLQFFRQWVSDALGLGSDYAIGGQFLDFLRYPIIEDPARYSGSRWLGLYPMLYVHGLSFAAGAFLLWKCIERARLGWASHPWTGLLAAFRNRSETAHTVLACLIGYGCLVTAANVYVWRHYLCITFPLEWVGLALLGTGAYAVRAKQRALAVVWIAQFCISATLLHYLHVNHGAPNADYGVGYEYQHHR